MSPCEDYWFLVKWMKTIFNHRCDSAINIAPSCHCHIHVRENNIILWHFIFYNLTSIHTFYKIYIFYFSGLVLIVCWWSEGTLSCNITTHSQYCMMNFPMIFLYWGRFGWSSRQKRTKIQVLHQLKFMCYESLFFSINFKKLLKFLKRQSGYFRRK